MNARLLSPQGADQFPEKNILLNEFCVVARISTFLSDYNGLTGEALAGFRFERRFDVDKYRNFSYTDSSD